VLQHATPAQSKIFTAWLHPIGSTLQNFDETSFFMIPPAAAAHERNLLSLQDIRHQYLLPRQIAKATPVFR